MVKKIVTTKYEFERGDVVIHIPSAELYVVDAPTAGWDGGSEDAPCYPVRKSLTSPNLMVVDTGALEAVWTKDLIPLVPWER